MWERVRSFAWLLLLAACACGTLHPFREGQASFDSGLSLFNQGKFEESIPYFERATVQTPDFAEAYFYLGRAHVSLRHWRQAIPSLRTAYRLAPDATRQEVFNLLMDAFFAAAMNTFPPDPQPPTADRRNP
ncbi:MAG TPA: tetratricopeptide repeat protein [Candidatus Binatia bacterium]|jgi:tetratricopeptide (TPR) repeat protein